MLEAPWRAFKGFMGSVDIGKSQKASPMKPQNLTIALMLAVVGSSVPTVAETPAPAPELQVAAAQIDFDALHQQARQALADLRRLQKSRAGDGAL